MKQPKPKKCKNCKEIFNPFRPLQRVCSLECSIEDAKNVQKKKEDKKWKDKKPYTHNKEYKAELQKEINKLARQIDGYFNFNCIDCDRPLLKQVHGSHFHNVQGNENIRYNLHNIHASTSDCNKWHGGRKKEYKEGLEKRYSLEYADYVDYEMGKEYKYIGLNELEVVEALKVVRKINREFNTFKLYSGEQARRMFNKIIGIYKTKIKEL